MVVAVRDPDRHARGDGGHRRRRARARRRADRAGRLGRRPDGPPDARRHLRAHASTSSPARATTAPTAARPRASLDAAGVRVRMFDAADCPPRLPAADLVIDAAYGTGFRGAWRAPRVGAAPVLAVDIPSGVDGLTGEAVPRRAAGRPHGHVRRAQARAAARRRPQPGRRRRGRRHRSRHQPRPAPTSSRPSDVAAWWRPRPPTAHKWSRAVRVVAGSPGMTGAAHLAAGAAQRAGSGMVHAVQPGRRGRRPARGRAPPAAGVRLVRRPCSRTSTASTPLVIGPGLGREEYTVAAVRATVRQARGAGRRRRRRPVRPGLGPRRRGAAASAGATSPTVLTPHDGEYGLLAGHRPGADRIAAARRLAADLRAVVLLKGPATVVADPDGDVLVVASGDARLATAGTGDVLSGHHRRPARPPAWLRSTPPRPGRGSTPRPPRRGPPVGLVAGDLVDALPAVLARAGMTRRRERWAWAEIDLDAVAHNVGVLRAAAAPAAVWAVVKADGYGHGAVAVGRAALAAGCDGPVRRPDRGGRRAARGRDRRADPRAQRAAARARRDDRRQPADADGDHHRPASTRWPPRQAPTASTSTSRSTPACTASAPRPPTCRRSSRPSPPSAPRLRLAGIFTHLAVADEPGDPYTGRPARPVRRGARRPAATSTASPSTPPTRPARSPTRAPGGRSCAPASPLYGISPGPAVDELAADLRPVLSLQARVSFVKRLAAGVAAVLRAAPPARRRHQRRHGAARLRRRRPPRPVVERRRADRRPPPADRRHRHDGPADGRLWRRPGAARRRGRADRPPGRRAHHGRGVGRAARHDRLRDRLRHRPTGPASLSVARRP